MSWLDDMEARDRAYGGDAWGLNETGKGTKTVDKFTTESGSVYELDPDRNRIRRVSGEAAPTERQGPDGEWRDYAEVSPVRIGDGVLIVWEFTPGEQEGMTIARSTVTSPVVSRD